MDDDTPSWLVEDTPEPVAAAPPVSGGSQPPAAQHTAAPQEVTLNEKSFQPAAQPGQQGQQAGQALGAANRVASFGSARRKLEINQWVHWLRFVNMGVCVGCSFCAVVRLMELPGLAVGTLAIYVFAFAVLFCCFEVQFDFITKLIGGDLAFLYTATGRLTLLGFTALLLIILNDTFSVIAGAVMGALALVNFFILCKFPDYTEQNLRLLEDKALQEQQYNQRQNYANV